MKKFKLIATILLVLTIFIIGTHLVLAQETGTSLQTFTGNSADAKTPLPPGGGGGGGGYGLSDLAASILRGVLTLVGYLLSFAASLFVWVIDPKIINNTIGDPIVYKIWAQVRDVVNVAFILMLLFSAFCTIFQVEKYSYKKILVTLIIMALLVNFSFPIARFIIDVANVLMYYFINALGFGGADGGKSFRDIIINGNVQKLFKDVNASIPYLLAQIVFSFLFAVTLLVIGVLLVVRLIVLTILVIFSSVAFVGSVVPFLSSQASKWWDALFKHAFFGPIMIFMIYVAALMMAEINKTTANIDKVAGVQTDSLSKGLITAMVQVATPIVILWVGLGVAQSLNVAAAGAVTGMGKKVGGWGVKWFSGASFAQMGFRATVKTADFGRKAGISYVGRNLAKTKYGKYLNPKVYKEAWERRFKEAEQRAYEPAIGSMQNRINKILGGPNTDYEKMFRARLVNEKRKDMTSTSKDWSYLFNEMTKSVGKGRTEAVPTLRAGFAEIWDQREYNAMMDHIKDNLDNKVLGNGKSFRDIGFNELNTSANEVDTSNAISLLMREAGASEKDLIQTHLDIGDIAGATASSGYGGAKFDRTIGDFRLTTPEEQKYLSAMKMRVAAEPQRLQQIMHKDLLIDERGNFTGQEIAYHVFTKAFNDQANRARGDKLQQVAGEDGPYNQAMDFANEVEAGTAALFDPTVGKSRPLNQHPDFDPARNASQAQIIRDGINAYRERVSPTLPRRTR